MKVYDDVADFRSDVDKMVEHFAKAVALRDESDRQPDGNMLSVADAVVVELDAARAISESISEGLLLLSDAINLITGKPLSQA